MSNIIKGWFDYEAINKLKEKTMDDLITRLEQMAARIKNKALVGTYKPFDEPGYGEAVNLLQEAANEIKTMRLKVGYQQADLEQAQSEIKRLQAERDLLKADYYSLWEAYNAKWISNPPR